MPYRSALTASAVAVLLFLIGCAGPSQMPVEAPSSSRAAQASSARMEQPQRELPGEVTTPEDFRQAIENGTRTTRGVPGPDYWQNTAAYTLTARLFPEEKRLEGTGRIVYQNNSPDTLDRLHLELAQNLHKEGAIRNELAEVTGGVELQRVMLGGQVLETDRTQRPLYQEYGTQLILALEEPVLPGEQVEIEIDWRFTIPQQGASGRMGYNGEDLLYIAYWYPIMAVYDDVEGWFTDQFTGNAEFYAGFGNYDVVVEAPEGWIVQSTGALQNADEVLAPDVAQTMRRAHESDTPVMITTPDTETVTAAGQERLRWRFTAQRVRDVAFSLTRDGFWEGARTPVGDRDGDGQTDYAAINTFWRPQAPLWDNVTEYQQHSIRFLSDYTGIPYPYPHMSAVEGGGIIGGGMEFPMMTLMGDYNARGDSALYFVTAHELAHMWVPMIVGTNERRYSWMDEGTTTFAEGQARRDFYPDAPRPEVQDQESYLGAARQNLEGPIMRRSDYQYSGVAFGVASYPKPASMLVALRGLLGQDTFLRAYRGYLSAWAYKHPYPQDFFNAFEDAAGEDLDWFWDSFYYETWTLDQALARVEPVRGGVRITVEDQDEAFLPTDLTLTLENGETLERRIPVETWLEGRTEATVTIETPAPVERVEIDAARHFPDTDRSDNVWTRSGGIGDGTASR